MPERRAQVVEGRDFLPGQSLGQPIAQSAAEREGGPRHGNTGTIDQGAEHDAGRALRRERCGQVKQSVPVDGAVGVDALVVGGGVQP